MDYQGWRARLEHSWRLTVDQIVALSVACHDVMPPSEGGLPALPALAASSGGDRRLARLVGHLMAAHDELAEIEAALDRIKATSYGICEGCARPMSADWLDETPHARSCPDCSLDQVCCAPAVWPAGQGLPAARWSPDLVAAAG